MSVKIFFCYAHEDEALLNKLKAHLRPLQRQGLIDVWYDRDISAGAGWEQEIKEHLDTAQIILLLVSPDFMDSEYCYSIEMKRALERHANSEAKIIPIILRHVFWHGEPLGKLNALPTDGKPVTGQDWHDQDSAFYDITNGIYKVVGQLTTHHAPVSPIDAKETPREAATLSDVTTPTQHVSNKAPFISPFQLEKHKLLRTITLKRAGNVLSVAISADNQTLVSGNSEKRIKVWNLATGREVRTLTGHADIVRSVAISADNQTLVSGSDDKRIKVWNLATGREVRTLTGHTSNVLSVAISADNQTLVSGSDDKRIKVWNLATGREVRTLNGHTSWVASVAISPDGQTIVSGGADQTIRVWNLPTGKEERIFTGHTSWVASVAISPDSHTLVSGSWDSTIKVWNLLTGKEEHTLTGHTSNVLSVAISADNQTLISGSDDKTIKIWNLATGREVRTLDGHAEIVWSVAISADSQTLVSGSMDDTIKVWRT